MPNAHRLAVPQADDPLAGLKTYQPGRGTPSAECPSQSQALLGLCIRVTYDLANEVHGSSTKGKVPTSRITEPRSDAHGLGAEVSRDPHQNRSV